MYCYFLCKSDIPFTEDNHKQKAPLFLVLFLIHEQNCGSDRNSNSACVILDVTFPTGSESTGENVSSQ